jgi:L-alanine-DL-glutamate epimerase-like enolase superfamily enzyme
MKIERVEVIPFRIPYSNPVKYGKVGNKKAQEHVLVRVHADGLVGTAEATPRPIIYGDTVKGCAHAIETLLAPRLVQFDAYDREGYWDAFDEVPWNYTGKGALDTAVYDLLAQAAGVPLANYLGGAKNPVRISYMLGLGDVKTIVDEALGIRAKHGITAFKIKAGKVPKEDIEVVRALREHLGDDAFLFIDANQLYSPEVAVRTINKMADYGLAMAEEPVNCNLAPLYRRRVAEQLMVPMLGDDSVIGVNDTLRELQTGALGVIGIKPPRSGMFRSTQILKLAEAHGIPVWIGSQGVTGVGTLASGAFATAFKNVKFPADLGNYLRQEDDLLATPIDLRDGHVHLPDGPGISAIVDEEKLNRFRSDR